MKKLSETSKTEKRNNKYRYEFEIYTDVEKDELVPVYKEVSEEEKQLFREKYPDCALIPKRILVGKEEVKVTIKKDMKIKRMFNDIRGICFSEAVNEKGKKYKNRFLIEQPPGKIYLVHGKYSDFKTYIETLEDEQPNKISF